MGSDLQKKVQILRFRTACSFVEALQALRKTEGNLTKAIRLIMTSKGV